MPPDVIGKKVKIICRVKHLITGGAAIPSHNIGCIPRLVKPQRREIAGREKVSPRLDDLPLLRGQPVALNKVLVFQLTISSNGIQGRIQGRNEFIGVASTPSVQSQRKRPSGWLLAARNANFLLIDKNII